jgi:hypothetical protein
MVPRGAARAPVRGDCREQAHRERSVQLHSVERVPYQGALPPKPTSPSYGATRPAPEYVQRYLPCDHDVSILDLLFDIDADAVRCMISLGQALTVDVGSR